MDNQETLEPGSKEVRGGRPPKTIAITVNLSVSDHATLMSIALKKMKQTCEDVPRERVISEAIQSYAKSLNSQE